MSLANGTRLGAYEIIGQIGAGGMGEVYRATDSKLGRDVAIKTLPAAFARDKDRLARFEREARLLAALNHAHIASVYGLDEHEGIAFIAMELVEGETLETRLAPGALPPEEALQLGLQIAQALEAAHENGIVHRDLKPSNIMVATNDVVKVLDFGLAKVFSTDSGEPVSKNSPTLSMAMTQQGIILGTAGYMSPEQASGLETDQRADVWSFGVILYEMLTGLPLFSGESVSHVLADVLKTAPDWDKLPGRLHPRIRLMLERCLAKKPRDRYHAIADARIDIEAALQDPNGVTPAFPAPGSSARQGKFAARVRTGAAWLFCGVISTAVVAFVFWPQEPAGNVTRTLLSLPEDLPYSPNVFNHTIQLSRDARRVYYRSVSTGRASIAVQNLASLDSDLIYAGSPVDFFVSPNEDLLGFTDAETLALNRIAVSTRGRAIELAGYQDYPRGTLWLDDGSIIVAEWYGGRLLRLADGANEFEVFSDPDPARGEAAHSWPSALPGGEWMLHTVEIESESIWLSEIFARHIETGEYRRLIEGGSDARYVPTGHLVYVFEGSLRAVTFDVETFAVGEPVTVIDELMATPSGAGQYSFANNGMLLYALGDGSEATDRIGWLDPTSGDFDAVPFGPGGLSDQSLSPDGTRVVFTRTVGEESKVFVWSFADRRSIQLTLESGAQSSGVWTPDAERVIYYSSGEGLFMRRADGSGQPEAIYPTADRIIPYAVTDEGSIVVVVESDTSDDIGLIVPGEEPVYRGLLTSRSNESRPALSPNGLWLAYESDQSGPTEIYVSPFPNVESGQYRVSTTSGQEPKWSVDGGELWFEREDAFMRTAILDGNGFRWDTPVPGVSTSGIITSTNSRSFDLAADGRVFVRFFSGTNDSDEIEVVVVHNWFDELERLVPPD